MLRYRKVFNSSTNKLILHQSFVDFLASFVFILNRFLRVTTPIPANAIGALYCKLWWSEWPLWALYVTSTYNLVAISMERYFATCHSIAHRNMLTSKRLKLIMVAAWLCGWIPEAHLVPISYQLDDSCEGFWPSRIIQAIGGVSIAIWEFVIPLSIMIFAYTRIIMELHKRSKNRVGNNSNNNDAQNMLSKANKNVTKTLFVVAIFFAICWAPTDVNYILYHSGLNENSLDSVFYQVAGAIVLINMCINPIIYCFTYDRFQKQAWKMVSDVCKRPQNRVDIIE
ncbi:galanin receptor type 1-like [Patiria miniata]|uniref:G-protein coupled receptors family 1 profile domain-containing protein n=1 Tax=Patiria miniata TaxID=46514 RepID=A0A914BMG3_PATMI|nr:galanin receptor type 1-like [Patiria miniata]